MGSNELWESLAEWHVEQNYCIFLLTCNYRDYFKIANNTKYFLFVYLNSLDFILSESFLLSEWHSILTVTYHC